MKAELYPEIARIVRSLDTGNLAEERRDLLRPMVDYIQSKVNSGLEVRLNFICTHNSRRSHFAQIWAQVLAAHCGVPQVCCYSGGTEATALFSVAVETLENEGFRLEKLSEGANPVYSVKFGANVHPVIAFSKTYDHSFNPESGMAAVMTCSQADKGCPFIPAAESRFPLTYEDPREYDQSPERGLKYRECNLQIATEMKYIFSKIIYQ